MIATYTLPNYHRCPMKLNKLILNKLVVRCSSSVVGLAVRLVNNLTIGTALGTSRLSFRHDDDSPAFI